MAQADDTVAIHVTSDVARLIDEAVTRGHHSNASEAIRDAFKELNARRGDVLGYAPEEISRLWDEGIASGPGREVDFEEIKREARRHAAQIRPEA